MPQSDYYRGSQVLKVPRSKLPATPTGVLASDGVGLSVTVTWSAAARATTYSVYRSTAAGQAGALIGASITVLSWVDTTAVVGQIYYYGVVAVNSWGSSALSVQNAGSVSSLPLLPATPTGVATSDGEVSAVTVTWLAAARATTYSVYRSTVSGQAGAVIAANVILLSIVDVTAVPGQTYYYGVVAINSYGSSSLSTQNAGSAAALPPPPEEPPGLTINSTNPTGETIALYQPTDRDDGRVWLTAPLRSVSGTYFNKWQRDGVDFDRASTTSLVLDAAYMMTAVYSTPATNGVVVNPGTDTLVTASVGQPDGTTYLLKAGVHLSTVYYTPRIGDTIQGENGAIYRGSNNGAGGFIGYGGSNINVTIRNLVIENFNGTGDVGAGIDNCLKAVNGWVVENCEIHATTMGVVAYYTAIVRNNYIHTNALYAIVGAPALIEGNVIYNNNTSQYDPNIDGVTKLLHANATQVRGNLVEDNYGNGLWADYDNKDVLYENNIVRRSRLAGINNEANCAATIRYNVLENNNEGVASGTLSNGGQIFSRASCNLEMYGNDVTVGSGNGKNAVSIRWDEPPYNSYTSPQCGTFGVTNVSVHDNVFRFGASTVHGYVGNATTVSNVGFLNNKYIAPSLTAAYFMFGGSALTFTQWQALGQDTAGSISL